MVGATLKAGSGFMASMAGAGNLVHGPVRWKTAYFWCLCTVVAVVRATCPEHALQKAMMCTASLGLGPPSTPDNAFVERGQIEVAKEACSSNRLTDAITCLEDITAVCQGSSDQEHFLRNMIDVSKARVYVTFFCSHLDEYESHAPCIARMHPNQTQCVLKQRQNMETKVKASGNMDFLMTSACKYFFAAEVCTKKVLTDSCSPSAADMVARVFNAFKPPLCDSVTYVTAQSEEGSRSGDGSSPTSGAAARSRSSLAEMTFALAMMVMAVVWTNLENWKCV